MKGRSKGKGGKRIPFTVHEKDLYGTPDDLYAGLDAVFHFNLDAAASAENARCVNYIDEAQDFRKTDYIGPNGEQGRVFQNPPYSTGWKECACQRAIQQVNAGIAAFVVMLLPANTADGYWTRWVWPHAAEILTIDGRLAFKRPGKDPVGADFPSAVVVFRLHLAGPAVGMIDRHGRIVVPAHPPV